MLVIIDEYSRMSWVYFMTYKSDVAEKLLDWKQEAELESGENLIKIRSDGAPEFKKIVKAMGIIHELSTADTPKKMLKQSA